MRILPSEYDDTFMAVLHSATDWRARHRTEIGVLWPQFGRAYEPSRSVLVLGRATNGWGEANLYADAFVSPSERTRVCQECRSQADASAAGDGPLSWVENRQEKGTGRIGTRSPFWRVTRRFVEQVDSRPAAAPWWDRLGWTNLAKVAPRSHGNPSGALWRAQRRAALEALKVEVRATRPRFVLAIIGDWLSDITPDLPMSFVAVGGKFVTHVADQGDTRWIVTLRPERRPEEPFVNELFAAASDQLRDL